VAPFCPNIIKATIAATATPARKAAAKGSILFFSLIIFSSPLQNPVSRYDENYFINMQGEGQCLTGLNTGRKFIDDEK
jgi:hypothetical protein